MLAGGGIGISTVRGLGGDLVEIGSPVDGTACWITAGVGGQ